MYILLHSVSSPASQYGASLNKNFDFPRINFYYSFQLLIFKTLYSLNRFLLISRDRQTLISFLLLQNTSARNYIITSCVFQLSQKHGPKIKIALATKLERIPWLAFMWLNVRVKGHETTMGNNGNIVVAE